MYEPSDPMRQQAIQAMQALALRRGTQPQMPAQMPPRPMGAAPALTPGMGLPPQATLPPQAMGGNVPQGGMPTPNPMALQNANANARFMRPPGAVPTSQPPAMPPNMGRGRR